jgi:hypothetical protein
LDDHSSEDASVDEVSKWKRHVWVVLCFNVLSCLYFLSNQVIEESICVLWCLSCLYWTCRKFLVIFSNYQQYFQPFFSKFLIFQQLSVVFWFFSNHQQFSGLSEIISTFLCFQQLSGFQDIRVLYSGRLLFSSQLVLVFDAIFDMWLDMDLCLFWF